MALPLAGVRVVDFTWVIAGPSSTKYLAAMGADVIKIESAAHPDTVRNRGTDDPLPPTFMAMNYSKRSATLNCSTPRGQELAKDLIRASDVVVENFAPGVMEKLGLDYRSLKAVRPDIIMVSSSGLGKTGPFGTHLAYGMLVATYTGIDSLTGYEDDGPRGIGVSWADPLTGTYLALAMLAALHHRRNTGEGQYVDVSMAEVVAAQMPEAILDYTINGTVQRSRGNVEEGASPHGCYPCQGPDSWVAIAVTSDEEWRAFCRAIGDPPWCRSPRFADAYSRFRCHREVDRLVAEWTRQHSPDEVLEKLQAASVPAGPSLNGSQIVQDPQLAARGFFQPMEHPIAGVKPFVGVPWQLHPRAELVYRTAPLRGQHNDHVFGEILGLSADEIERLIAANVIN